MFIFQKIFIIFSYENFFIFISQLKNDFVKLWKIIKNYIIYSGGRQTASLKVKICGPQALYQQKIYILKTIKTMFFVIETYN